MFLPKQPHWKSHVCLAKYLMLHSCRTTEEVMSPFWTAFVLCRHAAGHVFSEGSSPGQTSLDSGGLWYLLLQVSEFPSTLSSVLFGLPFLLYANQSPHHISDPNNTHENVIIRHVKLSTLCTYRRKKQPLPVGCCFFSWWLTFFSSQHSQIYVTLWYDIVLIQREFAGQNGSLTWLP